MCRLFAQHADPLHLPHEPLCVAHNALRVQSHRHRHGWGIGWYDASGVQLRRGVMPAHADEAFAAAAREARSEIVLAHVRDASVGEVVEENTHPFSHGRWLFAHNGTVSRFRRAPAVRRALEAEIDPRYRALLAGDTDSERCFFLFLTLLDAHLGAGAAPDLEDVRRALSATVETVARLADRRPARPSSLNLLVTNGEVLAVCRRGRTLHVAPHIATSGVFAIASEPIGAGPWREVPEGGFVGIDPDHRVLEA
ncbi:class II glutamine amidotransferase [Anaeromyxobacter diazotrophicus]|uniref:Class II glutamine amidotransferase n=1 Tax=Anaeromyxobacter diazotrophicus TaxID=2590199 RepID=A0A7I9VL93_9BACT|nr:class II glutamine amidotransferase [Anaeromyxobacter diazotrophicus]GEJ57183.1 class II glutamine amidotransferase [Anaeromyxobacter diazotrophicus]